jgi:hypothetical protein
MSDDPDADDPALAARLRAGYRTVTPPYLPRPDREMDAVGWTYFLVLLLLFVPFLPLIVVAWLLSKVVEFLVGLPGED